MNNILGIDLGTNSIGWAIRDKSEKGNQIISNGVLTFDKGVGEEKGVEFPKVKKRTESRGKRRNYQAEKYRKWGLLEFLIQKEMCPLTIDELDEWRKYQKGKKRKYPQTDNFINWLRFDFNGDGKPDFHLLKGDKHESYYLFRAKAVSDNLNDKNIFAENPHILGRVFYQLVQRRGFKGRDEEEAKTMLLGSEKNGTPGRNDIAEYIEKYKTLGAALYNFQIDTGNRIRQRYNLRKDYESELREICRIHNLDNDFYKKLWKAIIWQRPLRTQKGLIGLCTYEKNKRRAPVSHPLYEEFRTWVFINNLKIKAPEGWVQEEYLKEKIYPLFYKSSNDFKLSSILTQLRKDGGKMNSKFKENTNTKVLSVKLLNQLQDVLGEDWKETYKWEDIYNRDAQPSKKNSNGEYTIEDIWHVLYTFDSEEKLKEFAENKLELNEENSKKFSKIKLQQGYATLSLSAIKKILPYLRKNFLYSKAVYMANLPKVMGTNDISDNLISYFAEEIDTIFKQIETEKEQNNIVNGLIKEELIAEGDYILENNRELDISEINLIDKKIKEVIGEKTWEYFDEQEKNKTKNYVASHFKEFLKKPFQVRKNAFLEQPRLHQQIFNYLQETYDIPDKSIKYLWHPSEQEKYPNADEYNQISIKGKTLFIKESVLEKYLHKNSNAEIEAVSLKLLGNPEPISKGFKNPMALKTLYKLKYLLNYLLQTNQIDENTKVVVEIARELNNANQRKAIERWQTQRERENQSYREIIEEINVECQTNLDINNENLIHKIRLWEEQNHQCLYTGNIISKCDLLDGNKYDLEHTIPASMSFDNELKNLTVADTHYNRNIKKKLMPSQLPNYNDNTTIEGNVYTSIEPRLQPIKDKVKHFEELHDEWLKKTKYASTKEVKDACIQRRHFIKFDLDYWRKKLDTFTIEEYKVGWRNSQLRDTQIMTKYAVPYLKTVFNRVDVQKGNVVNNFKEIYKVKLPFEKKDRKKNSHHAIDAAILTLIPSASYREKILEKYNWEKDNHTGKIYHEEPKDWNGFKTSHILDIEDEILINNLKEYRTLTPTYKKVRKRGVIYRNDDSSLRWAKGDSIRGQLHGESLYGAIKQPKRDEKDKIIFSDEGKMLLEDKISLVIRKPFLYKKDSNSPGFKTLNEIEKVIVDKALYKIIDNQIQEVIDSGGSFKSAMDKGIWMLNKRGEKVNKIRRIRCFESLKHTTAVKVHKHSFQSDKEHKQSTYAQNGENVFCLFYKGEVKGKEERAINIIGIFDLTKLNITDEKEFYEIPLFNSIEKRKTKIPLYHILKSGQKTIFYRDNIEELKELSMKEISQRMYKMYQFESDGRIKLKHHLISGSNTDIKKEHKELASFDFENYSPLLRLRSQGWNFAIENKDFTMNLDGTLKFKF